MKILRFQIKKIKLIFSIAFLFSTFIGIRLQAQWYQVPDTNFQSFLSANFVTALQGDSINSTDSLVLSTEWLDLDTLNIASIQGIQGFQNLKHFSAKLNQISDQSVLLQLPLLESIYLAHNPLDTNVDYSLFVHLTALDLNFTEMSVLPLLPDSLEILLLAGNHLDTMPDLSVFSQLKMLDISSNDSIFHLPILPSGLNNLNISFTSISPSELDTLQFFPLSHLQMAGLNLSQLPLGIPNLSTLLYLNVNQNPLGNLSVLPPSLLSLFISNTQCNAVINMPGLEELVCSNNSILAINILPSSLKVFDASNNPVLSALPSNLPSNLLFMNVSNCNLQALPSLPVSLSKLVVLFNQLDCLPILNANLSVLLAVGNNIHCLPNIPNQGFVTDLTMISCGAWNPNNCPASGLVHGLVFYDHNNNGGLDFGEPTLPGVMVSSGLGYSTFSNDSGYYQSTPPLGLANLCTNIPYQLNNNCVQVSITPTFTNMLIDFPVDLLPNQNDLMVQAANCIDPRPFQSMDLKVITKNQGSMVSGQTFIKLIPDNFLSITSASHPYAIAGDTLVFNLDTLEIGEQQLLHLWFDVSISAPLGHIIEVPIWINNAFYDASPVDNHFVFSREVVNSFDPNDKIVFPSGMIEETFLDNHDSLTYTIRFQNTGTAPAINIRITDSLSQLLDVNSFRLIGSSHPTNAVLQDHLLSFYFNGIYLPDSTNDEPNSHGFVRFSIKFSAMTALMDTVQNDANIYFDFNEPVLTNSTLNFISKPDVPTALDIKSNMNFTVYPLPADKFFHVVLKSESEFFYYSLLNLNGQVLLSGQLNNSLPRIDVSNLAAGLYNLRLFDGFQNSMNRKVVIMH
jgi:uncharacterized repeat protein (TIGR01451 family)